MSADELRKAAETLREKASLTRPGPWEAYPDGLVWDVENNRPGDPISGSTEPDDARYIATMHPGVGLALADVLDAWARMARLGEGFLHRLGGPEIVSLARLINGGAS